MHIDDSFLVDVPKVSYDQISGGKHQKYRKVFFSSQYRKNQAQAQAQSHFFLFKSICIMYQEVSKE